ncbi:MAG TPA: hypothetical protein VGS22_15245 [Thermoanaerobaculia bacterium]|jgi:hypothetical protein|nr:hypothetical protein [Thermoanaerobaculia bacterium]
MPTHTPPRRRSTLPLAAFTLLALSVLALPAPAGAAPFSPWDLIARFADRAAAWTGRGIDHLFGEQGTEWDPSGRPAPPPAAYAPGGLGFLSAEQGTQSDPNGRPDPLANGLPTGGGSGESR